MTRPPPTPKTLEVLFEYLRVFTRNPPPFLGRPGTFAGFVCDQLDAIKALGGFTCDQFDAIKSRLEALEKIAHTPYDFTVLVQRLEALERPLYVKDSDGRLTPAPKHYTFGGCTECQAIGNNGSHTDHRYERGQWLTCLLPPVASLMCGECGRIPVRAALEVCDGCAGRSVPGIAFGVEPGRVPPK